MDCIFKPTPDGVYACVYCGLKIIRMPKDGLNCNCPASITPEEQAAREAIAKAEGIRKILDYVEGHPDCTLEEIVKFSGCGCDGKAGPTTIELVASGKLLADTEDGETYYRVPAANL